MQEAIVPGGLLCQLTKVLIGLIFEQFLEFCDGFTCYTFVLLVLVVELPFEV